MRALIIAAGLCLAATTASAGSTTDATSRATNTIALANGCVYAPNASGQANAWTLVYTQSGTTAKCALNVRTQAPQVSRNQTSLGYVQPAAAAFEQDFVVGVFR